MSAPIDFRGAANDGPASLRSGRFDDAGNEDETERSGNASSNRKTRIDASGALDERQGTAPSSGNGGTDADTADDDDDDDDHMTWARDLSWLRRPNERWLRPLVLLLATGSGMIIGPRIELGTQLVCEEVLGIEKRGLMPISDSGTTVQTIMYALISSSWNVLHGDFLPAPRERPPLSSVCRRSPAVEAGYTALSLRISLTLGILSTLTTGFWGGLSDRKGRTPILRLSVLGLIFSDLAYIALGIFPQTSVPFGKNLLVAGVAFEGALGGIATLMAAHMAYISDVTPSGTRATVFSFFTGLFFCGFAVGPGLGGLLAKRTKSTMAPFYFALAAHVVYLVFATLFLPESKSPQRMRKARNEYRRSAADEGVDVNIQHGDQGIGGSSWAFVSTSLSFLSTAAATPFRPLVLLMPHRRHDDKSAATARRSDGTSTASHPRSFDTSQTTTAAAAAAAMNRDGNNDDDDDDNDVAAASSATHRTAASHISVSHALPRALDWNLTLVALAYFLEASSLGIVTPKINYAMYKFDWDGEQVGYFLSFSSLTRVACLTIIFPLFVKWVHRPVRTIALPQDGGGTARRQFGSRPTADDAARCTEEAAPLLDDDGRMYVSSPPPAESQRRSYGATVNTHTNGDVFVVDDVETLSLSSSEIRVGAHAKHIERLWMLRGRHLQQLHDSTFDRRLALGSLAIAALSYFLLAALSDAGPVPFVALSALISLGGAASAGLSSLALALLDNNKDAGKFFAAWSVLSAVSQTIVGPIVFSAVFARTVSSAPQTIFVLGFALFVFSALAVAMIRVRTPHSLPALPPRPPTSASTQATASAVVSN